MCGREDRAGGLLARMRRRRPPGGAWGGRGGSGECFTLPPVGLAGAGQIAFTLPAGEELHRLLLAGSTLLAVAQRFDATRAEIDKITHENAMRWYRFDPYAHRPKEQCTVAALRAEVEGHDVSVRSMDTGRRTRC